MKSICKEEMMGISERHFISRGGGERASFLEGSQATPTRHSDRKNVKVKTL
jgi:hypothetical protein